MSSLDMYFKPGGFEILEFGFKTHPLCVAAAVLSVASLARKTVSSLDMNVKFKVLRIV